MIENSVSLSNNVFVKSPEVVNAAADYCVWFASQEQAQLLSGHLVQEAGLSKHTFDIMMWQIAVGFCTANFNTDLQNLAVEQATQLASRQSIADEMNQALRNQVHNDIASILTFGIYNWEVPQI